MKRWVVIIFCVIGGIVLFSRDVHQLIKYQILEWKLEKRKRKLLKEREEMKQEIELLEDESSPYVEELIRKELNYILPDEYEIRFDTTNFKSGKNEVW